MGSFAVSPLFPPIKWSSDLTPQQETGKSELLSGNSSGGLNPDYNYL